MNEFILYGLSGYKEIIEKITGQINDSDSDFEIKLILTEALTNAFKHGNDNNADKPIYLRYIYEANNMKFEIEDSGRGFKDITIPDEVTEEDILKSSGRGLYLIKCIADKIEFKKNKLVIHKQLADNKKLN